MGMLDDLVNAYSTAGKNVWDAAKPYVTSVINSGGTASDINNALASGGSGSPVSAQDAAQATQLPYTAPAGLLGPAGFGGGGVQQTAQPPILTPDNTGQGAAAATPAPAPSDPSAAGGGGAANLPTDLSVATGTPDVTVNDDGSTSSGLTPDQQAAATQGAQVGPGLLTNIMQQAQSSVSDPNDSQSFLGKLGSGLSDIGDKLTHLSPAASQGFLAAGMAMLANNGGKLNLSQLVGTGGQAGLEQYQTVKQNQIAAQLKQQELAQSLWEKQQDIITERNRLEQVQPGSGTTTIAQTMAGQGPSAPAIPKITLQTIKNQDGTSTLAPFNEQTGQQLGNGTLIDASIPEPQQKNIQDAVTAQGAASDRMNRINDYINQLSPTITGPDGKPMQNPNYVSTPGGLWGDANNAWTKLTGSQTAGQQLQQQILRELRTDQISNFKNTGAARITNGEYNTMVQGLNENVDSASLANALQIYGRIQQVAANRAQATAEYLGQNRGMYSALNHDSPVLGHTYKAGTPLNDIVAGTAKPIDGSTVDYSQAPPASATPAPLTPASLGGYQGPGGGGGGAAPVAPAPASTPRTKGAVPAQAQTVVNQAITAARNGDKNAQAALAKRGISWS